MTGTVCPGTALPPFPYHRGQALCSLTGRKSQRTLCGFRGYSKKETIGTALPVGIFLVRRELHPKNALMPFDGKRLIFGRFETIVDDGGPA